MADDGLSRTTTNTHDLMVKPSTWDACSYAGGQHCPCETVCAATRLLLGDDDEATQLDNLEAEVRANGLERVLDTGIAATPRLRDIAARKLLLPENQRPDGHGAIWNGAEVLSILLYTGSDVQGVFRQDMMASGSHWPVLAAAIERALKKQRAAGTIVKDNHFASDHIVYHGLHGVNVKSFESFIEDDGAYGMTFSIGTVVSASYNRDMALLFAAGCGGTAPPVHSKGLLLEIYCRAGHWPASADVEWCSKFPHEKEVIIAPWQHFDPRVGNSGGGATMTPRSSIDGKPARSVAEAVAALESRTDTIALDFMLVALEDSRPPLKTPEDWAAEAAEGEGCLKRSDVEAFPFLRSKAGECVLAFSPGDVKKEDPNTTVDASRWRLAMDPRRKKKGWIRSSRLQPYGKSVQVQVLKVDLRVPDFRQCGWVSSPVAEGEPPATQYCKSCKRVFRGTACSKSHANYLYTKVIPDGAPHEAEPSEPYAQTAPIAAGAALAAAAAVSATAEQPQPQPAPSVALVGTLTEPLCYLSLEQEPVLRAVGLADMVPQLPGWVSQTRISHALVGEKGARLVAQTAQHNGNFVWATEFANVHSTFVFQEPPILVGGEQHAVRQRQTLYSSFKTIY
jgi:hypothetical protein